MTTLMGDKVEPRRRWIESHVQFTLEEDGSILENKETDNGTFEAVSEEVTPEANSEAATDEISLFDLE